MSNLLIWGAGDQGLVTLDCALATKKYDCIDFLDFIEKKPRIITGYTVYVENSWDLKQLFSSYDEVIVATGSNDLREYKCSILKKMEVAMATLIHPSAVVSPFAKVAAGCTVLANSVINTNAFIDVGCIINNGAIVDHDCIVSEYVNICPNVSIAGHTQIGRKTFIGVGASIIDEIVVGDNVIIGAGSVVIHDIDSNATAVGVPAKSIK